MRTIAEALNQNPVSSHLKSKCCSDAVTQEGRSPTPTEVNLLKNYEQQEHNLWVEGSSEGHMCLPSQVTTVCATKNNSSAPEHPMSSLLRETIPPEKLELISRGNICGYPLHLHVCMPIIETNPQSQLGSHVTVSSSVQAAVTKYHSLGSIQTTDISYSAEAGKSKVKVPRDSASGEDLLLVHDQPSCWVLTGKGGLGRPCDFFCKGSAPSHVLLTSQSPISKKTIALGLLFNRGTSRR